MYELLSGKCLVQERGLWGTNRTPKRVRYRRRVSGVQTALRNVFGTGEGPLGYKPHSETCSVQEKILWGYKPHSETCSVQEKILWGTNRTPKRVRYRRGASGVRTTLRNMFGTGEGPLGYELLSGTCLVQERGLWGTSYSPERVWYRRGASDVRNAPQNTLGIGKWAIVYRINEKRIPVQGLYFIRLTITILTEIFDNYEELQ